MDTRFQFQFQCFEWYSSNDETYLDELYSIMPELEDNNDEEEDESDKIKVFTIRIFGVTKNSESVCLKVKNFPPYFYIRVPDSYTTLQLNYIIEYLQFRLSRMNKGDSYLHCIIRRYSTIVQKKDFYGFTNGKIQKFFKLVFNNSDAMKKAVNMFNYPVRVRNIGSQERKYDVYEGNVDPLIRFMHTRKLLSAGWIQIKDDNYTLIDDDKEKESRCKIEIEAEWYHIDPLECDDVAPFIQASFDIECNSVDYSFPKYNIPENYVIQIATAFKRVGDSDFFLKHIIVLGDCAPINKGENKDSNCNVVLECYKTEKEVLLAWRNLLHKYDPDVIYSYNGDGFDCEYMYERAKLLGILYEWSQLGRLKNVRSELKEEGFSSSAYGDNKYKRLKISGRINYDILTTIKREYKLSSYKLDNVAKKYLGQEKHGVSPKEIFEYFQSGDPEKVRIVAEYCIQDTLLPQRLVDKLGMLLGLIEMAKATYVPVRYLFERGQLIKVYSQVLRLTKDYDYLIPTRKAEDNGDSFKGAIVLEPKVGCYFEPVTTLDFASLYPSIIRAHKMCYCTFIMNEKYDNLEGIEYFTIEWEEYGKLHRYRYAQIDDAILPKLLDDLYAKRKATKKLMKQEKDEFKKMVLDKKQLSYKVSMNSVYGFLAGKILQCKPIAASVTTVGRKMIEASKSWAEEEFPKFAKENNLIDNGNDLNVEVIAGDSVTGDTPLIVKSNITGLVDIKTIDSLCSEWFIYHGFKEQGECEYKVWSEKGWNNIKRIIKHKTDKDLYKVISNTGIVKVTEDHSLINEEGTKMKPLWCNFATRLLTFKDVPEVDTTLYVSEEQAKECGRRKLIMNEILNCDLKTKKAYLEGWLLV